MNQATVVKVQTRANAIDLRLWVDDERGHHLCVAEVTVPATTLALWWVQVREAQDREHQDPLPFDV